MGRSSKSKPKEKIVRGVDQGVAYTDIINEKGRLRFYGDCEMRTVPGFPYKVISPVRRSLPIYPDSGDDDSLVTHSEAIKKMIQEIEKKKAMKSGERVAPKNDKPKETVKVEECEVKEVPQKVEVEDQNKQDFEEVPTKETSNDSSDDGMDSSGTEQELLEECEMLKEVPQKVEVLAVLSQEQEAKGIDDQNEQDLEDVPTKETSDDSSDNGMDSSEAEPEILEPEEPTTTLETLTDITGNPKFIILYSLLTGLFAYFFYDFFIEFFGIQM